MKHKITFLICLIIILYGCNAPESEIPETLIGNYYNKSGEDFWCYSLQKKFVIFDSQFWNVTKVVNRKDITKIFIKNENSKKRLLITQISNSDFNIEDNKISKIYSKIANPDIRKAKNSPFALHPGKVQIYGFIKNSTKYVESNPRIHFLYHDYITVETYSVYAPIDSLGRFQLEMKLLSAQDILYQFDNKLYSAFVSPNDTLMIYFDPENPKNTHFQGTNSDVNYDLLYTQEHRFEIASPKEDNNQLSKHFDEYKTYRDSVCKREMRFFDEYSMNEYCSELFKIWFKTNSEIDYNDALLNYSWKNYYSKDVENSMEAYNAYLDTFFGEINTNDSVAQITGRYFFYINTLNNKIPLDKKAFYNSINDYLKKETTYLSMDERKLKASEFYNEKMIQFFQELKKGRLTGILYANLISREIKNRNIDNIENIYNLVKDQIEYKPYLTHISNFVADFKRKELEFANNPITFKTSNSAGGQLLKEIINENKDKIIILDFWFTGCGACRSDFKSMKEFKKDLALELDVAFVYLCYGSAEKDWKFVSKEFDLKGSNYLLTQEQLVYFQDLFTISGAPRYILINKVGKVVNSNFRPPMNKNQYMTALKNAL
jgi:thiol-disulfide isomerase/thioredoxin